MSIIFWVFLIVVAVFLMSPFLPYIVFYVCDTFAPDRVVRSIDFPIDRFKIVSTVTVGWGASYYMANLRDKFTK